ncbi:Protein kinase domain-containing protein [Caenorhabditis elegans]|uniref:Protein kinase domain-containing protein n=1 Tax=Caenorhabditis elegans TaxID=6239 RepID=Q22435_CAEEL|nr:Protein kinase domain-containing protein [Caenorhabditis elegans]CAA92981.2 Protein kinase domain-containing protein [Caenorhabditis elegans]|eukprot:NP_001023377.2 Uncharacterized protein CELE_T12G3.2 [Caenorhabditis elegans]
MVPNDVFQKLLYDLFCMWHGVQRHYDPPIPDSEEQRMQKVKNLICKLLTEIDGRVNRIKQNNNHQRGQDFYEEWTMLTWNVLCITNRLQNSLSQVVVSNEDKMIYSRLNQALVELVNYSRDFLPFPSTNEMDPEYVMLRDKMNQTMMSLHGLYRQMNSAMYQTPDDVENFRIHLQTFGDDILVPCLEQYKTFCNKNCMALWQQVRLVQVERMRDQVKDQGCSIENLVSFYSNMTYVLAVLGARLQGFRYDLTVNKKFFNFDPVVHMSEAVFAALELLMSNCVLATEPSTSAILVTNNLFAMNCGALARGVVFKDFEIQVVSEETAEHIQSEMSRQRLLQHPAPIGNVPSAALLAMKPTTGTKRSNAASNSDSANNTAHKKSDVNSKESVIIYPVYNSKNRYWAATYPHLLCTTRQKGRQSIHSSYQDLSPSGTNSSASNDKNGSGKRPIFYFHIKATMFSPSGRFATAHTLSLPFTIATRRNQDCQVQRMMSSYTATIFWLYGCNTQDGLLLQWIDGGMHWDHFKHLFKQHFKVNADVQRSLIDNDFELLKYKLQCPDCCSGQDGARVNGVQQIVTFKNVLCPHLRYECNSTNVRFSVWRGMLELLQIFHDTRNNVRKLWEMGFLMGFMEFEEVDNMLEKHKSALIMRLSFVTGGTICFTVKSLAHTLDPRSSRPIHLEPLDLKRLQQKCLKDYLRDIADAEKVKYILTANEEVINIESLLESLKELGVKPENPSESREISSNITHMGDIDTMQHIKFTAMRIAVVTCKVKPPSADQEENDANGLNRLQATLGTRDDDFLRDFVQLANAYGKSKQDLYEALDFINDQYQPGPIRKTSSIYDSSHHIPLAPAPIARNMGPTMISPPPAKVRPPAVDTYPRSSQFELVRSDSDHLPPSNTMMRVSCSPPKPPSQLPSPNQTTIPHMYNNGIPMIYEHHQQQRFDY